MPSKYELAEVFSETLRLCRENETLREAVRISAEGTKYYPADFSIETRTHKAGNIRVVTGRTLETALKVAREFPGKRIAVLNFASGTTPGGGVHNGSRAQEESICRSSTLYPSISTDEMQRAFYIPHSENYTFRGWDDCIYSPGVVIFRDDSDEIPEILRPEDFVTVDVVTCAAPHLRDDVITAEELFRIHVKRAENILRICAHNGVDIFIGGAFGCGAFHNDPYIVAWAWREALKVYREKFSLTVFAIYAHGDDESNNYRAFRNEFAGAFAAREETTAAKIPTRQQMIEVFNDTLKFFDEDSILYDAISRTNDHTKVYPADFAEEVDSHKAGKVEVIQGRTLQTALGLHGKFPEKRIAVLNFAASQTPGGGVKKGSRAQEESICRSSTLYPSLKTRKAYEGFYGFHHDSGSGWLASDTCIYSPDVIICKNDDDYIPARLSRENFVKIDVITCAAPHIFPNVIISDGDLYAIHLSRAKNILRVCAFNGVDILITGAFGCGAFKNPAEIAARSWREALRDYREKFDLVVFAVKSHKAYKKSPNNFDVFREELSPII